MVKRTNRLPELPKKKKEAARSVTHLFFADRLHLIVTKSRIVAIFTPNLLSFFSKTPAAPNPPTPPNQAKTPSAPLLPIPPTAFDIDA